jgi:mutator protein MutT
MTMESTAPIRVVAGILRDGEGRVLVACRPSGKAFAGRWEFPGGKVERHETAVDALVRELREELGIEIRADDCRPLLRVEHLYPGAPRAVAIEAWVVDPWCGEPSGLDGQRLAWHPADELAIIDILEADRPIVTALRLGNQLHLPREGMVVHEDPITVEPARHPAELAAALVADAPDATEAVARGADLLLVAAAVTEPLACHLEMLGRPWYVRDGTRVPQAFTPTGYWSR